MLVDLGIAIPRSRRESRDNQKSRRGSRCDLEDQIKIPGASSSRRPSCCELAPPDFPSSRRGSSVAGAGGGGGGFVVPPDNCDLQVPCPPSYKESQQ